MSFSEYMQQALAMRFVNLEECNLCDVLLERIGSEDSKKIVLHLHRLTLLLLLGGQSYPRISTRLCRWSAKLP